jgi:hypothetical protein
MAKSGWLSSTNIGFAEFLAGPSVPLPNKVMKTRYCGRLVKSAYN